MAEDRTAAHTELRFLTATPETPTEAFRWLDMILSRQPHGKTAHEIEQELSRARDLLRWLEEHYAESLDPSFRVVRRLP